MTLEATIYESSSTTYTKSLYQHDKNVTLVFNGIDLPEKYEVSFANEKDRGISVSCEGDETGVKIPDELLSTGEYVYCWVCNSEEAGTNSLFMVVIPVIPRPIPIYSQGSSSGSGSIKYDVDPDDENLIFHNALGGVINPNIEEET